jgi:hypothetical protein
MLKLLLFLGAFISQNCLAQVEYMGGLSIPTSRSKQYGIAAGDFAFYSIPGDSVSNLIDIYSHQTGIFKLPFLLV